MSIRSNSQIILQVLRVKGSATIPELVDATQLEKIDVKTALSYLLNHKYVSLEFGSKEITITARGKDLAAQFLHKQVEREPRHIFQADKISELSNRLERIENKLDSSHSRAYRETTYKSTLYQLLIASVFAIAFTSIMEYFKAITPLEHQSILTGTLYFLAILSITTLIILFTKLKQNMDIQDYVLIFKIKNKFNAIQLGSQLQRKIESREHVITSITPSFEGLAVHNITYFFHTYSTNIPRQQEILKNDYYKHLKAVKLVFEYVNEKGATTEVVINLEKKEARITIDKTTGHEIATKLLLQIMQIKNLEITKKAGWDH